MVNFIMKMLGDSPDVQVKKVAYISVVSAGIVYLGYDLYLQRTLTSTWTTAFGILTGFVSGAYVGGKIVEGKGGSE